MSVFVTFLAKHTLSTTEVKDNNMQYMAQIKIISAFKAVMSHSDSDTSTKFPRKKKAITGVLLALKKQGKKNPKYKDSQH